MFLSRPTGGGHRIGLTADRQGWADPARPRVALHHSATPISTPIACPAASLKALSNSSGAIRPDTNANKNI